jgi:hypothetical protein
MLSTKARAQIFIAAVSGDALQIVGENAAMAAAASPKVRGFMVVFLDGQRYQRPTVRITTHQARFIMHLRDFSHL